MVDKPRTVSCPDCDDLSRRNFLKTSALAAASASTVGLVASRSAKAGRRAAKTPKSETLVTKLHESLTAEQKAMIVRPFDDPLRQKVDNNWRINDSRVGEHFTKDQQALIRDIFMGLHSPEYAQKVMDQVQHDNKGRNGFGACSIALFGEPGTGKFEFVFTGRHVTRRCDGDSVEGAAFGGPIFYGHSAQGFNEKPDHPGNAYWYQAVRANELFGALDGKQRQLALLSNPRPEEATETVRLSGKKTGLAGIPVTELSSDQKELVRKVMADVLAPFRKVDAKEAMKLVEAGGFENLHMSYYQNEDIGDDGVWDVWQIEGPAMVWYFRGAPHVHTWVHIRQPA